MLRGDPLSWDEGRCDRGARLPDVGGREAGPDPRSSGKDKVDQVAVGDIPLVALLRQDRRDESRRPQTVTEERGESGRAGVGAAGEQPSSVQLREPGRPWSGLALGDAAQCLSTECHLV